VLIVGAGRVRHGDDAVGIVVARWAARRLAGLAAAVVDVGGWDSFGAMEGRRLLVIVDAAEASEGLPAGGWMRIDPAASPGAVMVCRLRDTHTAGVDAMLRLARAMGKLPPDVWIYAIGGEGFAPEARISQPVRRAAIEVAGRIEADVRAWAGIESPQTRG